ncbi:PQQ-dependent sugar dehydrogenase [Aminobacter aminovorans]|jgi:glucose/arabinose dehydrogenase|uniref:Glucose/arabinose dehydrogenase n=1 Tax=Aminobacter aminovorans TaxID=83263 RepID=A0AAC8YVG8_AMIAI|nr:sorbosone dehydrogenase family protein [Aminobacter aminovorans]AMS45251.1 Putative L-sorbosone dehydrogenase (SNDH) [Aminobacter aminovorans]MBB3704985.1 glucose/arabinose dehydrogenase [Aminobacter aminovorans]
MKKLILALLAVLVIGIVAVGAVFLSSREEAKVAIEDQYGPDPKLPEPDPRILPTVHQAEAEPWRQGEMPKPAEGYAVNQFADGLDHPRWLHVLPNGDVLVAESNKPPQEESSVSIRRWVAQKIMGSAGANAPSANRISILRDADGDGEAELKQPFITGLFSPFGMTLLDGKLYVANADGVVAFPYQEGATEITAQPEKIADLPAGLNHHWTKDVIASQDGTKLYATVGSNSNVGENGMDIEEGRAAVHEIDLATKQSRLFASGLRNPNGLSWQPDSGELWVVVNERDEIGSDLVPDYMTSVKDGAFYGWPYSYYGQIVDDRIAPQMPDLVAKALKPDYALGSHTASLGLTFNTGDLFGPEMKNGAFVGQHGSWNRIPRSGYKVIFVPFSDGKPAGPPKDILTGFLRPDDTAAGRPVGVAIGRDGSLLVADDVGNGIWRVRPGQDSAALN